MTYYSTISPFPPSLPSSTERVREKKVIIQIKGKKFSLSLSIKRVREKRLIIQIKGKKVCKCLGERERREACYMLVKWASLYYSNLLCCQSIKIHHVLKQQGVNLNFNSYFDFIVKYCCCILF